MSSLPTSCHDGEEYADLTNPYSRLQASSYVLHRRNQGMAQALRA